MGEILHIQHFLKFRELKVKALVGIAESLLLNIRYMVVEKGSVE